MTIELSSANFARRYILRQPKATTDQVRAAWAAQKMPRNQTPQPEDIYNARGQLKTKYDLKDLSQIPMSNGKVDYIGLAKLLMKKNKNSTDAQLRLWLAHDGFDLTDADLKLVRTEAGQLVPLAATTKSVVKRTTSDKPSQKFTATYRQMEADLDDLMVKAQSVQNSVLVEEIRAIRRSVIVAGMQPA